jgi:UDP-GlcNAc:undecaprenyl-phosphate/decaprenyl-phosphate GlcNAc-1-phosphate transferase
VTSASQIWLPWATALGSGLVFVPLMRGVARTRGWIAPPKPDRWHRQPTALMGGVAIWAAVLLGIAAAAWHGDFQGRGSLALLGGASFLCAIGVIDDRRNLKPASKVVAQLIAAAVAVAFGYKIRFFHSEILNLATSFFWIVAITNAVNLLDNMDGLAAGIVMIGAAYIGWMHADSSDALVAHALVGSLAAFLLFNFNPASIFMGDGGSMFIGYLLAGLSLARDDASNIVSFVAVPAATLMVPILDTSLVTATRLLRGRSIAEGGRDHTSHRLVMLGLSEREAVGVLWFLALVAGASANFTKHFSYQLGLGLLPVIIIGFGLLGIYLSRLSFVEGEDTEKSTNGYVRLALDISYKRRVLEVLLDFVLIVVSYYLAYGLRFEFELPRVMLTRFEQSLPVVVAMTMAAFFYQGVYRGYWSYVSTEDLLKYVTACALAVLLSVLSIVLLHRFDGYPRSVFAIFGLLMFLGVGGTRISFRLMDEALQRRRPGRPVLIVGAGSCGEIAARELLRNSELGLKVVGFVDDDRLKQGRRLHGYPIFGSTSELERAYEETGFREMVISTKKLSVDTRDRLSRFAETRGIAVRFFRVELVDTAAPSGTSAAWIAQRTA